jgi:hypothetical protein
MTINFSIFGAVRDALPKLLSGELRVPLDRIAKQMEIMSSSME